MRLPLLPVTLLVAFLACAAPVRAQPFQAEAPPRLQTEPRPRPVLSLRAQILHPMTKPEPPPAVAPVRLTLSLEEEEEGTSAWAYVAGGVLLAHGILAAVLLGMDDDRGGGDDEPGFPLPPGRPE